MLHEWFFRRGPRKNIAKKYPLENPSVLYYIILFYFRDSKYSTVFLIKSFNL